LPGLNGGGAAAAVPPKLPEEANGKVAYGVSNGHVSDDVT